MSSSLPVVTLKPRKALPFFSHHPWVFATAIQSISGNPSPGSEVLLKTHDGQPIARGLFNPHSQIRIRLYSWNVDEPLDEPFWKNRIESARGLRQRLPDWNAPNSAMRLISSEADGLSGLTVDRYGEFLLAQVTSLALYSRIETFLKLFQELFQPKGIWLRTEKGIRAQEGLEASDGLLWGESPARPLFLQEHGIRYAVDVTEGQKTGLFLDQRENRRELARYAGGAKVLDLCCYNGGFGLNCLKHGNAKHVTAVDVSGQAIQIAKQNAELNHVSEQFQFLEKDAFKALEDFATENRKFDLIILDPPKLARHRNAVDAAIKGYYSLNRLAVDVLEANGLLMTFSCSGLVDAALFEDMLAKVSLNSGRRIQILERRGAAPDHPLSIHCPESEYLKGYLCRVE